jgi:hypothetical protein
MFNPLKPSRNSMYYILNNELYFVLITDYIYVF